MTRTDGGIELLSECDWESIVAKGGEVWQFQTVSRAALEEQVGVLDASTGPYDGDFPPLIGEASPMAEIELKVEGGGPKDRPYFVVNDPGEPDRELAEIIRRQETLQ
jgi:hypothetical protein